MCARIKEGERALVELERYSLRLAWLQKHFLKSFQLLDGAIHRRIDGSDIEFGNLSSRTPAGIGHRETYFYEVVILVVVLNLTRWKTNFGQRLFLAFAVFLMERLDV
jgi:hypothetical protein